MPLSSRRPEPDALEPVDLNANDPAQHHARGLSGSHQTSPPAVKPARTSQRLTVLLSGLGLLTDIYDFQVINLARAFIEATRPGEPMSAVDEALITSAAIVGAIVGMVCFGALADRIGRRTMFLATAFLTTAGALGSALASSPGAAIYNELATWRFIMGLGIGGEYPLSAANTAEHAQSRGGRQLATTFSMMGWGGLLAPVVFLALESAGASDEAVWRMGFAFGALLSSVGIGLRLACLSDAPRFVEAKRQGLQASARHGGYARQTAGLMLTYRRPLFGTAGCWFLYDIFEYGLNLYTTDIIRALGLDSGDAAARAKGGDGGSPTMRTTLGVLVLRLLTIPGYLLAIWLVDAAGRKRTLDGGFVSIGLCFAAIGILWPLMEASPALFVLVFGLAQVCDNAGCGVATYVIPGEIYTSSMRATCHGVSAAAGKLGAAVGAAAFPLLDHAFGLRAVFLSCAAVCVLGLATSHAFVPTYDEATVAELDSAHARGTYLEVLYAQSSRRKGAVQLADADADGDGPMGAPMDGLHVGGGGAWGARRMRVNQTEPCDDAEPEHAERAEPPSLATESARGRNGGNGIEMAAGASSSTDVTMDPVASVSDADSSHGV